MKRIHYLLLGLLVSLTIAAVSPSLPPTRIIAGNSTVIVVTNGVNNFTLTAGGIGTSNGSGTNTTFYSAATNQPAITVATGVIRASDGSALAPAYSFATSTNLGLYASGGSLVFCTPNNSIAGYFQGSNGKLVLTYGLEVNENITLFSNAGTPMAINRSGTNLMLVANGLGAVTMTNLIATNITASTFALDKTITAPATTGNQTINKAAGRVNIAAAGTTVVVTCSLVTADSIIIAVAATDDATAMVTSVVPAAGSFTINTVATTAETAFNFLIVN